MPPSQNVHTILVRQWRRGSCEPPKPVPWLFPGENSPFHLLLRNKAAYHGDATAGKCPVLRVKLWLHPIMAPPATHHQRGGGSWLMSPVSSQVSCYCGAMQGCCRPSSDKEGLLLPWEKNLFFILLGSNTLPPIRAMIRIMSLRILDMYLRRITQSCRR